MDSEKELREPEQEHAQQISAEAANAEAAPERPNRGLEGFYENFRGVPLKYLDAFIIICIVLLVAIIAFGVFQARG